MSRTELQQIVVVALLIAFGIVWNISRKGNIETATALPPPSLQAETPPLPKTETPPPEISRDPFLPPSLLQERIRQRELQREEGTTGTPSEEQAPASIDLSKFQLQGIFWGAGQPQAIINRRALSVGDKIEGATITSISKNRVVLEAHGQETELKPTSVRSETIR